MERFQDARSETERRSKLFLKAGNTFCDEFARELGRALGPGEIRFKVGDAEPIEAAGPHGIRRARRRQATLAVVAR